MRRLALLTALAAAGVLGGCDLFGGESPEKLAAAREADGRAIGGACRHAGRAIEDCFALNKRADRAAIFAGWRDMNDYMRENKIEPVAPQLAAATPAVAETKDKPKPAEPPKGKSKDS
jgi:hypothetical protein